MSTTARHIHELTSEYSASFVRRADVLQGRSEQVRSPAQKYADALISEIMARGDDVRIIDGRIKSLTSCMKKALLRREGDMTQIPDGYGMRVAFNDPQTVVNARELNNPRRPNPFHTRMESRGYTFIDFQDMYKEPTKWTGRVGVNICLRSGSDSFEIQLINANMIETESATHPCYKMIEHMHSNAAALDRKLTEEENTVAGFLKAYTSGLYDAGCWHNGLMRLRSADASPAYQNETEALTAAVLREPAVKRILAEYRVKKLDEFFIERSAYLAEATELAIAEVPAQSAEQHHLRI